VWPTGALKRPKCRADPSSLTAPRPAPTSRGHERADTQTQSDVEIVTFGCRLNGWEREVSWATWR